MSAIGTSPVCAITQVSGAKLLAALLMGQPAPSVSSAASVSAAPISAAPTAPASAVPISAASAAANLADLASIRPAPNSATPDAKASAVIVWLTASIPLLTAVTVSPFSQASLAS